MGDTVDSKKEYKVEDNEEVKFKDDEEEPKSELNADKAEKQLKLNISMQQYDIEAHIFRTNFNNVNFEYFEL